MSGVDDTLKRELQDFFTDGLAVIVGSGLSLAAGIPGMTELASHLLAEVPCRISQPTKEWTEISASLAAGKGLEATLLATPPSPDLEKAILDLTTSLIEIAERRVIEKVVSRQTELPFSRLLPHLNPQPSRALPVITTNYDRLLEVASEMIGWGVDTMFIGQTIGVCNEQLSHRAFIKEIRRGGKTATVTYRDRIQISKPHGSIDWFQHPAGPIRTSIPIALPRLIITPGSNKYQKGYGIPFDRHREIANASIDQSARLLILGYGFNDDHLEVHLGQQLRQGKPALILTHSLSPNGLKLVSQAPNTIALCHDPDSSDGVICIRNNGETKYSCGGIWDLSKFIERILTP